MTLNDTHWVLIPCHNNVDLLQTAIKSVLAQTIPVRIFAINNGSQDNTDRLLNSLDNRHIVIHRYPQLGVSGAWNLGLHTLFKSGVQRVLVINQDVELHPTTYEELLNADKPFVTGVSTNDRVVLRDYRRPEVFSFRPHPDFSCFAISRDCYQRIGPFDEGFYPAWFEDNDYHIRAARAGIEPQCIDLPFYHAGAATWRRAGDLDQAEYYGPGFRASKQRFLDKWGCLPGTKEYEMMCSVEFWRDHV